MKTPPTTPTRIRTDDRLTPWQECLQMIRSLDKKSKNKRKNPNNVLQKQESQVEFLDKDGGSLYSGTIVKGFLFDYLADKPEVNKERPKFCILDEDEDGVPPEESWGSSWSGRGI